MAASTAAISSRVTFRAAPVRGAKAVSSKAARAAPLRNVTTRASIADLPKENKDCKVLVVGGTGYIGKFVVRELCAQGYDVTAFVRDKSGIGGKTDASGAKSLFPDASVKFGSVGDCDSIRANAFDDTKYDVVVSCLASRTGGIKDSWDIDYQATKNVPITAKHGPTVSGVLVWQGMVPVIRVLVVIFPIITIIMPVMVMLMFIAPSMGRRMGWWGCICTCRNLGHAEGC